jgi:thioredoxin 1
MNKLHFCILSILLLAGTFLHAQKAEKQNPFIKKIASDSAFVMEINNHEIVVVDFWAIWCKPCQLFLPEYEATAKELHKKVAFYKLDCDLCKATMEQYNVQSIPTIIIFKNGKEVKRIVGVTQKPRLIADIKQILGQ